MPRLNGIEATERIVRSSPHIGVLVVTMMEDEESVFAAVRAGARGYLLKGARRPEIVRSIEAVGAGEVIFGPGIAERMMTYFKGVRSKPAPELFPQLTERERMVLARIAAGLENAEIARRPRRLHQDGAQPREQHLREAAGRAPRPGHRAGPGGRPGVTGRPAGSDGQTHPWSIRASSRTSLPTRRASSGSTSRTCAPPSRRSVPMMAQVVTCATVNVVTAWASR